MFNSLSDFQKEIETYIQKEIENSLDKFAVTNNNIVEQVKHGNTPTVSIKDYIVGDGQEDDTIGFKGYLEALKQNNIKTADFEGCTVRVTSIIDVVGVNCVDFINGTMFRDTQGTTGSGILRIKNCKILNFLNMCFKSNYSAFESGSTGSNALVELSSTDDSFNDLICFNGCVFDGGNIASILIDGRYNPDGSLFTQTNISIMNNELKNAGVGVFAYKGIKNLLIENNSIYDMSSAGLALDTHAGDSDLNQEPYEIKNAIVRNNAIKNIKSVGVFQPRGITLKGKLNNISVLNNIIANISAIVNQPTFGIVLVKDGLGNTGQDIDISNNNIRNINNLTGSGAWLMSLQSGYEKVKVSGNNFFNSARGILIADELELDLCHNNFINTANVTQSPIWITNDIKTSFSNKRINIFCNYFMRKSGSNKAIVLLSGVTANLNQNSFDGYIDK